MLENDESVKLNYYENPTKIMDKEILVVTLDDDTDEDSSNSTLLKLLKKEKPLVAPPLNSNLNCFYYPETPLFYGNQFRSISSCQHHMRETCEERQKTHFQPNMEFNDSYLNFKFLGSKVSLPSSHPRGFHKCSSNQPMRNPSLTAPLLIDSTITNDDCSKEKLEDLNQGQFQVSKVSLPSLHPRGFENYSTNDLMRDASFTLPFLIDSTVSLANDDRSKEKREELNHPRGLEKYLTNQLMRDTSFTSTLPIDCTVSSNDNRSKRKLEDLNQVQFQGSKVSLPSLDLRGFENNSSNDLMRDPSLNSPSFIDYTVPLMIDESPESQLDVLNQVQCQGSKVSSPFSHSRGVEKYSSNNLMKDPSLNSPSFIDYTVPLMIDESPESQLDVLNQVQCQGSKVSLPFSHSTGVEKYSSNDLMKDPSFIDYTVPLIIDESPESKLDVLNQLQFPGSKVSLPFSHPREVEKYSCDDLMTDPSLNSSSLIDSTVPLTIDDHPKEKRKDLKKVTSANSFNFACVFCPKLFITRGALNGHVLYLCENKKIICKKCSTRFSTNTHLMRHQTSRQCAIKPFRCEFCENRFKTKHGYIRHKEACSAKPKLLAYI